MTDTRPASTPAGAAPRIVEGVTLGGKPCRVVDGTGSIDSGELAALLQQLIADNVFGIKALSEPGAATAALGAARYGHIQFGNTLYRLILSPYEARIEKF